MAAGSLALIVGVVAIFLLTNDTMERALKAIDEVEQAGSAFNSPEPMMLKTALFVGAAIYLLKILVNLHGHFQNRIIQGVIAAIGVVLVARLVLQGSGTTPRTSCSPSGRSRL